MREYRVTITERGCHLGYQLQRHFLAVFTGKLQEVEDGVEATQLGEHVHEVRELPVHNVLPGNQPLFHLVNVDIFLFLEPCLFEIYVIKALSHLVRFKRNRVLIIQEVIPQTTMTTTEYLLQYVKELISTLEYRYVFVEEKEVWIDFQLRILHK